MSLLAVVAVAASMLVTRSLSDPEAGPDGASDVADPASHVISLEQLRAAGF